KSFTVRRPRGCSIDDLAPPRHATRRPASHRNATQRNVRRKTEMADIDNEIEAFTIRDVIIEIEGVTPYSASRHPGEEKEKSETWDDFEARVWRKKCYATQDDDDGEVYIP